MSESKHEQREVSHNQFRDNTTIHQGDIQNVYCTMPHRPGRDDIALATSKPSKGPHFLVPFIENKQFVGREDILKRLAARLNDADNGSLHSAGLIGLGGIGKTQVALQLAYHARNRRGWSVFWLSALSMTAFEHSCTDVVESVCMLSASGAKDPKQIVKRYLESRASGRWLLIVDNADDMATLMGPRGIYTYLPTTGDGFILFTTRVQEIAEVVADDTEKLDRMNDDEARAFLQNLLPANQVDDDMMADFLDRLMFLPLAISQAAVYMKRNKTSMLRYLSLLRDVGKEAICLLSREFPDRTRYPESRHAVASTWLVSFEYIRKNDKEAVKLLLFLSQIEPRAIPLSMLSPMTTEESLEFAIGTLCGYSFLYRREDGKTLDMHSLVHLAAREWVDRGGHGELARREVAHHLPMVFRLERSEERFLWQRYMPHVLKAVDFSGKRAKLEHWELELGDWAGRHLLMHARFSEAIQVLSTVVDVGKPALSESRHSRLGSRKLLAKAYIFNGQSEAAINLFEHVEEIYGRTVAEDQESLLFQENLAAAYRSAGRIEEAVELLQHVVKIKNSTLAEDHCSRLFSQHQLGMAYRANGQVKEATEILQHVTITCKARFGEDHLLPIHMQQHLADAYQDAGRIKEAIELLEHVVKVRNAKLPEDNRWLLYSQHNLAVLYQDNVQINDAIVLEEHVVSILGKFGAPTHPLRQKAEHLLRDLKNPEKGHSVGATEI